MAVLPTGVRSFSELIELIEVLINWVFVSFLLIAVIFIILAAFQFLTQGGDPAQVATARKKFLFAGIAIAAALLAKGSVTVIRAIFGL
ncbi:MAG: hypothetical protein AAB567_02065 [Patescibacteria group bacterium]